MNAADFFLQEQSDQAEVGSWKDKATRASDRAGTRRGTKCDSTRPCLQWPYRVGAGSITKRLHF